MSSTSGSISTINNNDESIKILHHQEFQDLWQSIVKVTGKNTVQKLKPQVLTMSNRINATEISHWLCKCLWPHVKIMPNKWHKWSKHPKSICQRILSVIGVPNSFTNEGYWLQIALSITNKKICAL
jgi:hypothetical protein